MNTRCRKVLNTLNTGGGGGEVQNIGLIRAPPPNQYKIITFFTLKTNNIAKLRGELKSILLAISSNKIKGTYTERNFQRKMKFIFSYISFNFAQNAAKFYIRKNNQ